MVQSYFLQGEVDHEETGGGGVKEGKTDRHLQPAPAWVDEDDEVIRYTSEGILLDLLQYIIFNSSIAWKLIRA